MKEEKTYISEDLEEAAEEYASRYDAWNDDQDIAEYAFKAGAEWQKKQIPMPEDTVIFQKGVEEGKRLMMEESYEEKVQEVYRDDDGIHCSVSVGTDYKPGTIVYVITIPKEGKQ